MKKNIFLILLSFLCFKSFSQENSLLWSIVKPGEQDTSYLFGSIHISDERVFNVNKYFNRVFDKAELVALELNLDSINTFDMLNYIMMDSSLTLKKIMPPAKYDYVKKYFEEKLGQPIQFVERFQPIYTSTILQTGESDSKTSGKSLDETIFINAKKANKKVIGLEKASEQIAAFSSFPYRTQADILYHTVKDLSENKPTNSMEELILLYIKQDLKGLNEEINQYSFENDPSLQKFAEVLNQKLIIERNSKMLQRSIPLVKKNRTLIVVGAAHLPGNNGLIELYRKQGYLVRPLK